jgi:hypothetical protein
MLVRSQATKQRPANRAGRPGDQNSHRASLSARFAATRREAQVMLSCKHATHRAALRQNLLIIRSIAGRLGPRATEVLRGSETTMCHNVWVSSPSSSAAATAILLRQARLTDSAPRLGSSNPGPLVLVGAPSVLRQRSLRSRGSSFCDRSSRGFEG